MDVQQFFVVAVFFLIPIMGCSGVKSGLLL